MGLLARRRDYSQAEACFQQALDLHEADPLTHYHFAVDCLLPQGRQEDVCWHLHRALALRPRKERDRKRILENLNRHCSGRSGSP